MQAATRETVSAAQTASSLLPLDTLAATIRVRVAKGDKATSDADGHFLAAGLLLLEAKRRLPLEQPGMRWTAYVCGGGCKIGTTRANELIAIAEERTTPEAQKEKNRNRQRNFAARNKAARSNVTNVSPSSGDDCDNAEQRWERSLGNVAGDAISLCSFWTREFGEEWENFEVPSTAVTLAKQAAKAWTELADDLTKRRKAALN